MIATEPANDPQLTIVIGGAVYKSFMNTPNGPDHGGIADHTFRVLGMRVQAVREIMSTTRDALIALNANGSGAHSRACATVKPALVLHEIRLEGLLAERAVEMVTMEGLTSNKQIFESQRLLASHASLLFPRIIFAARVVAGLTESLVKLLKEGASDQRLLAINAREMVRMPGLAHRGHFLAPNVLVA